MDPTDIPKIEQQRHDILRWFSHPITQKLKQDNIEEEEKLVRFICDGGCVDYGSYTTAVGHLRGLRRAFGLVQDDLDEINEQLKAL